MASTKKGGDKPTVIKNMQTVVYTTLGATVM